MKNWVKLIDKPQKPNKGFKKRVVYDFSPQISKIKFYTKNQPIFPIFIKPGGDRFFGPYQYFIPGTAP
jgi:hypothetical protein